MQNSKSTKRTPRVPKSKSSLTHPRGVPKLTTHGLNHEGSSSGINPGGSASSQGYVPQGVAGPQGFPSGQSSRSLNVRELLEYIRNLSLRDFSEFHQGYLGLLPEEFRQVSMVPSVVPQRPTPSPLSETGLTGDPFVAQRDYVSWDEEGAPPEAPMGRRFPLPSFPSSGPQFQGPPQGDSSDSPRVGSGATKRTALRKARKALKDSSQEHLPKALRAYEELCGRQGKSPLEGFPEYSNFVARVSEGAVVATPGDVDEQLQGEQ